MKCYRRQAGDGHKYTSCDGKKKAGQLEKKKKPKKGDDKKKKRKKPRKEPEDYKPRKGLKVPAKKHMTRSKSKPFKK